MKKLLLLMLVTVWTGYCQTGDQTVTITGKGPRGDTATVAVQYRSSLVTLSVSNATTDASGLATVNILSADKTSQLPSGIEFELVYVPADVSGVTVAAGPAALAANKTLTCGVLSPASIKCVVVGLNQAAIAPGVLATVVVKTNLASQASTALLVFGVVSASKNGNVIPTVAAPGGGVISMPPLLASLSCGETPTIDAEQVLDCTATLNKPAPAGGITVGISSDSPMVAITASATIPAAALSAAFQITGQ